MRRSSIVFVVAALACAAFLGGCTPSGELQYPIFTWIPTSAPAATRAPSPTIEVIIVTATPVPPTPTMQVIVVTATPVPPTPTIQAIVVTATPEATATPAGAVSTVVPSAPTEAVPSAAPSPVVSSAPASPESTPATAVPTSVESPAVSQVVSPTTPSALPAATAAPPAEGSPTAPAAAATQAITPDSTNVVGVDSPVSPFGSVVFAPGVAADKKPLDPSLTYPEGTTKVYGVFSAAAALPGKQWRYEWYRDGTLQPELGHAGWDLAAGETGWTSLWQADGIAPGSWELRLHMGDRFERRSAFTIEEPDPAAPKFGPIRFADGVKANQPVGPRTPTQTFPAGTKSLYAFFDTSNMAPGLPWKREWYLNGVLQKGVASSANWDAKSAESDFWVYVTNEAGLPPGVYELKLYVEDKLVQLGTTVIESRP